MNIDRPLLDKIAHLSRLEFNEEDAEKMLTDMNAILAWVEKLKEVNTDKVEPLTTLSDEVNVYRDDEALPPLSREQMLRLAPHHDSEFFRVPKVID